MSNSEKFEHSLENLIGKLKAQRDEIKLRMHLASMDIQDEWDELEKKWQDFSAKSAQLQQEVKPVVSDVKTALSLLGEEISTGYKKIKRAL